MIRRKMLSLYIRWLRKDEFESVRLRKLFADKYDIDVGMYSYGCFDPSRVSRGTVVGRYCSIAGTAHILGRNHGMGFVTLHPYLYNESLEFSVRKSVPFVNHIVGDGAWIGHGAIILPSCRYVGRGAVVGAGAVVSKDVPDYSVVVGNPARIVKYRFSEKVIQLIDESRWWELSRSQLERFLDLNQEFAFDPSSVENIR